MAMKVSINDRVVTNPSFGCDTLEDLLDDLRRSGQIRSDEIVAALQVDRRRWASEDMDGLRQTRLDDVDEVAITTDDMNGYTGRILTDASGMLQVMKEATTEIAQRLRGPQPQRANRELYQLLEALQRFLSCLDKVQSSCVRQACKPGTGRVAMALLSAALDTVVNCQEREDWPALADQLDEHLSPAFDAFEQLVAEMMEQG